MTASHVTVAAYGAEALTALAATVADVKRDDPLAPVTIIAPNAPAGIMARRSLAAGVGGRPGIAGFDMTTLPDLAARVAATSLSPATSTPAGTGALAAAWRAALADDPRIFAPVAGHPATARALVAAHRELRHVDEPGLDRLAEQGPLTADVVGLHREVRTALSARFHDHDDVYERATALVADSRACGRPWGTVIFYLPQDFSVIEGAFAAALRSAVPTRTIVGVTGVRRADRGVDAGLRHLGGALPDDTVAPPTAQRVWHASDCDDEVRLVVRGVVESLAVRPGHRIAVLYAKRSPYARQLHEQMAAAGITVAGPGAVPLAETAVAHGFCGLLRLSGSAWHRADVFDVLAASPLTDPTTGNRVPVGRWERISRDAAIVAGDDWTARLEAYIAAARRRIEDSPQGERDDPDHYLHRRVADATALHDFITRLRHLVDAGATMTDWTHLAPWSRRLLGLVTGRASAPNGAREQAAAARIGALVDECAQFGEIEPRVSAETMVETVTADLAASFLPAGAVGDGVLVAPLAAAIGLEADEVFVLGVAEDVYPGRPRLDPLLPDEVRHVVAEALPLSRDELDRRQRHLLAAFMAAPAVTASFPRGDLRDGGQRLPSRWLLPTVRQLAGDKTLAATDVVTASIPGVTGAASHAAALLGSDATTPARGTATATPLLPATAQEWRTRACRAGITVDDAALEAAAALREGRAADEFTRFDGNLAEVDGLPDFDTEVVAPTVLETYADCPHAYFVKHLLHVRPVEQPEETITIGPLAIGNLMHECMDRLVRQCSDDLPDYGRPWSAAQRALLTDIFEAVADRTRSAGLTGHDTLWRRERRRLRDQVLAMLDGDDTWRAALDARVAASEMAFGLDDRPPISIPLTGGRQVRLRGSADKVDVARDGTVLVTDIKTGSARRFRAISGDNPTVNGTKLQLPVYAHAARARFGHGTAPTRALYWFVRDTGGTAAGHRINLDLSETVETDYARALTTLTDAIHRGLFPATPPEQADHSFVQCAYCNPDGVGHTAERDRWERKRLDPTLHDLVALIDPGAVNGIDAGADGVIA